MNNFGNFSLALAWIAALIGILSGIAGGSDAVRNRFAPQISHRFTKLSLRSLQLVTITTTLSLLALGYGFFTADFSNQYIWQFSNRDMPSIYRVSAIWGGMDGSMLLWCFFHAAGAGILSLSHRHFPEKIAPWMLSWLHFSLFFFLTLVFLLTNPFRSIQSPFIPPDGNGLNPLLQNPYMAIHPPMLYLGFTTLAIPYAFCMGALVAKETGYEWIRITRRWTLTAWTFLTLGICLGGYWAYIELGWGGFWAWDPVENASLMPWLTATAFLHSVMVQERKEMLKTWNIWLIVLSYLLTVFGTFLTRSGIVQSVHAFASTDIGEVFLIYMGIVFASCLVLTISRREILRSPRKIQSIFSKETAFLMNNLIFLSILFGTFWGVMFPVFSEALTGEKQAVGIPFFNAINVPLFLIMLFLMGVGPLISWRETSLKSLRRSFLFPMIFGLICGLAVLWAGVESFSAVTSYSLTMFVLGTLITESYRAARTQRNSAASQSTREVITKTWKKHQRRGAGFLVHLGVLIATIGITASMAHKTEREFALGPQEHVDIGRYRLELAQVTTRNTSNYESLYAHVRVLERKDETPVTDLFPELRFYKKNSETTTEVALRKGLREDLYIVLAGLNGDRTKATFKVYINPLQGWLWLGVAIMAFGSLLLIGGTNRISASGAHERTQPEKAGVHP
ncbi:heme lyase CcmF/NrfE family subunit [bacterium]|nr:heme lyase CcmF/NrfE family subunit [bacterium]